MRRLLLSFLLLALPATLAAQQAPALAPGHPLDPADVAILTGSRSAAPTPYAAYATPYLSYPVDIPLFSQPMFAPVSTATSPLFAPLAFGRIGRRPVALFSGPGVPGVPLFFVRGRTVFFATPRGMLFGFVGR